MSQIRLTECISPSFYECHEDILHENHTYYDLYGGRGSTKSSFVSLEIVLGMMKDKKANAVVFRKVFGTCKDSVYEQIEWAIDALGVSAQWVPSKSPLQFTYIPYGTKIIFRGLDKAKKTKSIKTSKGYFKYLWYEELDEFAGDEEIRMSSQSVLRGGDKFIVFKTFNPPLSINNWANKYVLEPNENAYRLKTDYRTVPVEWLGSQFIQDAEHLKEVNEKAYLHEYLGEAVGSGTNVFDPQFLEIREITDEEIAHFDTIYQGLDFGFYPDPLAFVRTYFNHNQNKIYLIDELYVNRYSNKMTSDWLFEQRYNDYEITCDSAEPKSIKDFTDFGLAARGAVKGPGSVEYGMKWLQSKVIVIDPRRTPNAYKEITEYEFDRNAQGEIITSYPDRNNHIIDALRYAYERLSSYRGISA